MKIESLILRADPGMEVNFSIGARRPSKIN